MSWSWENTFPALSTTETGKANGLWKAGQPLPRPGHLTIEPFGVILGSAKRWPTTQAAVDGWVPTREVNDGGCIELPLGGDDGCRVVARVIGAAGHTIDLLNSPAEVPHLEMVGEESFPGILGSFGVYNFKFFLWDPWILCPTSYSQVPQALPPCDLMVINKG